MDRSALRAILASNPLPTLPPDYSRQQRRTSSFILIFTGSRPRRTTAILAGRAWAEAHDTKKYIARRGIGFQVCKHLKSIRSLIPI